jgi:hypothetical protein
MLLAKIILLLVCTFALHESLCRAIKAYQQREAKMTKKSEAYLAGRKAAILKTTCPYFVGSREETDWLLGHYDVRFGVIAADGYEEKLE